MVPGRQEGAILSRMGCLEVAVGTVEVAVVSRARLLVLTQERWAAAPEVEEGHGRSIAMHERGDEARRMAFNMAADLRWRGSYRRRRPLRRPILLMFRLSSKLLTTWVWVILDVWRTNNTAQRQLFAVTVAVAVSGAKSQFLLLEHVPVSSGYMYTADSQQEDQKEILECIRNADAKMIVAVLRTNHCPQIFFWNENVRLWRFTTTLALKARAKDTLKRGHIVFIDPAKASRFWRNHTSFFPSCISCYGPLYATEDSPPVVWVDITWASQSLIRLLLFYLSPTIYWLCMVSLRHEFVNCWLA